MDSVFKHVNVDTKLHSIRRRLKAKHGMVKSMKLYLGSISPTTEMTDNNATLATYGIEGAPEEEKVSPTSATASGAAPSAAGLDESENNFAAAENEIVTIYYDFEPVQHESPLLLVSPRQADALSV